MNVSLLYWTTALLGQNGAAPVSVRVDSVWDFAIKGGPVMIPIGLCSLVALTVTIERLVTLRRRQVLPPGFVPGLNGMLEGPAANRAAAVAYCDTNGSALARMLAAGVKRLGDSVETVERFLAQAGEREVIRLRKNMRMLSVITALAPLLGLLGTIFGMITAFQTVATSGEALGRTELLARGIYEAMITTAAGLMVAIPSLACYHALSARVDRLAVELDEVAVNFVEQHARGIAGTAPKPADQHHAARVRSADGVGVGVVNLAAEPTSQPVLAT